MHHRIVPLWDGCVSRGPGRRHRHVVSHFLAGLDGYILHFAILQHHVSAFIEGIAAGDLVPISVDHRPYAGIAALLLVVIRQENDVPGQARTRALESDKPGKVCRHHAFVIDRPAPVDIVVLLCSSEGVHAPFGSVHTHNVQMGEQQKRL